MLLAFDTATQTASIAIYDLETHNLLSEWTWQARRRQTQELLATAQAMMKQIGLSPPNISALAVTTGPGSFTGVRIAISAAKGIGLGLPTPPIAVGIPTLSVTAAPLLELSRRRGMTVCAYLQAGRGRYNWAFVPQDLAIDPKLWSPEVAAHESGSVEDFVNALRAVDNQPILLIGESTAELKEAVDQIDHVSLFDDVSSLRRAGQLARLAAAHIATGTSIEKELTLSTLSPLYLRSP